MPPPTNQTLSQSIYAALGLDGRGAGVLGAIEAVIHAPDTAARDAAVLRLARTLVAGPPPGEVAGQILLRVNVITPYRHQKESGWRLGTYHKRAKLADELLARARFSPVAADREALAQAALLLAAQEGFFFGGPSAARVFHDPNFEDLCGWTGAQVAAVAAVIDDYNRRTAAFTVQHGPARDLLQQLIDQRAGGAQLDVRVVNQLLAALDSMILLAGGRPDLQWRVAQYGSAVANLALATGQNDVRDLVRQASGSWRAVVGDPVFDRWIDEVMSMNWKPPERADFRRLTAAEFNAKFCKKD